MFGITAGSTARAAEIKLLCAVALRDAAVSHDFTLRLKLVDPWPSVYHDFSSHTLLNTACDCTRCSVGDCDFVPRRFLRPRRPGRTEADPEVERILPTMHSMFIGDSFGVAGR